MATYNYTLTTPANSSFTITTSNTLATYMVDGVSYTGYKITGVTGTFNGEQILGILTDNPGNPANQPLSNDLNGSGGNVGQYDNVFFSSDTQGSQGRSTYGLDIYGLAFRTANSDYAVYYSSPGQLGAYRAASQTTYTPSTPTTNAPCYVTGTLIRTSRGDVAVEDLAVGDVAITRDGRRKPISWIGHRHVRCDRHPEPRKVHPVRVAAGTFGDGLPYADLWLSPGHALCLDNLLLPVRGLIDGERIVQVERAEVTYWHVEVEGHDVLLANGMPAESYLDTGNRNGFDNAGATALHFDEAPAPGYDGSRDCLPMVESGPLLSGLRARYGLGRPAPQARTSGEDSEVHLVADGAVIAPSRSGENELRFLLPAGTGEVRLVSPSFAAAGADIRRLGVIVGSLAVSDGAGWQSIALDDPGLYAGFHEVEGEGERTWRWTNGEAHLSPRLWDGLSGDVMLRIIGVFGGLAPAEARQDDERLAA